MVCPKCLKDGECRVENTRHACGLIVRYRRCSECRRRFRTRETADRGPATAKSTILAGDRISAGTGKA